MAAGLSIEPERIPEFRRALSRTVRERCEIALAEDPELHIDGYVALADLSLEFVEEMERLAPFGPGNPPLTLATRGVSVKGCTSVGRTNEHLKLTLEDEEGGAQEVLWWRAEESALPQGPFDLAYTARASDYQGQRAVQVEWIAARPIDEPVLLAPTDAPTIDVVDYRGTAQRQLVLQRLRTQKDVLVWCEGRADVEGWDRYALEPADDLVIWTTPPGAPELRAGLARVSPRTVHLFGVDPGLDHPKGFLTHLARLVKRAIATQAGRIELCALAAGTAQREETVRAGLAWLAARGDVVVLEERERSLQLAPGDESTSGDLSKTVTRLRELLEETAAYRAFFARADAEALIGSAQSPETQ